MSVGQPTPLLSLPDSPHGAALPAVSGELHTPAMCMVVPLTPANRLWLSDNHRSTALRKAYANRLTLKHLSFLPRSTASCQVYAYTRSPVTIAVMELFVRREALLPNLFVGAIRRDSILGALQKWVGWRGGEGRPRVRRPVRCSLRCQLSLACRNAARVVLRPCNEAHGGVGAHGTTPSAAFV